ncbi:hypothetical protein, partial [Escherichia coli]
LARLTRGASKMNPIAMILISFVLSFVFVVVLYLYEAYKRKRYVQRKQDDQRKFNPIREKQWWK